MSDANQNAETTSEGDEMPSGVVSLERVRDDKALVQQLRDTLVKLCEQMNAAQKRGIEVVFSINRANADDPKSAFIVTNEKITKRM